MSRSMRMPADAPAASIRRGARVTAVVAVVRQHGLRPLVALLAGAAVVASALMLATDSWPAIAARIGHGPASAAPLILIGAAYLLMAAVAPARAIDLLKRLMLATAFILWGIDQLMTPGPRATLVGDVVIALYVFDLTLIIRDHLRGAGPDTP